MEKSGSWRNFGKIVEEFCKKTKNEIIFKISPHFSLENPEKLKELFWEKFTKIYVFLYENIVEDTTISYSAV